MIQVLFDHQRVFNTGNHLHTPPTLITDFCQALGGDWLYVQSGYSMFGQLPGNVLLVFKLADSE